MLTLDKATSAIDIADDFTTPLSRSIPIANPSGTKYPIFLNTFDGEFISRASLAAFSAALAIAVAFASALNVLALIPSAKPSTI